jgi:Gpi18-like mannosyltransferase
MKMRTMTLPVISPSRQETLRRLAWRLDRPAGLAAMFAVAFVIRLLIAPHMGFYGDLRLFAGWAERLGDVGPGKFYVEGQFADYPPGYLYVLWLTGLLVHTPGYLALKLPALAGDLVLAWIVGTFAARLAPAGLRERWPVRTLAAAAVLFNPAVIGLSAVWGQVDVVPAALVLGSLLLLFTGPQTLQRELAAFAVFAVAIAMKPQSGFVLPAMLYALYRRYLHCRPRSELVDGALAIALSGAVSLGLWSISGLPFGLTPVELVHFYQDSASVYPVTSANAFNFWGALGFWRQDSLGDDVMTIAGIPALRFGMLVFLAGTGVVLWQLHRAFERGADQARALTVAAACTALLAYTFLTRMHERYLFAALAVLMPLVFERRLRWALGGLSALFVLNLWWPYAYFNSGWKAAGQDIGDLRAQPWFDWVFGADLATDTWQKKVWSLGIVAIVLLVVWRGHRWVGAPRLGRPRVRKSVRELAPAPSPQEEREELPASSPARLVPLALAALACVFGLVFLRYETSFAPNVNDGAFHLQMVEWAGGQIREGRVPLDGWFPYLTLGSAHFHHYQSLPHTLTAYAAQITGATDKTAYVWFLFLLLALWPVSVYLGARLLGWGRWTAAAAAAVSPLVVSASGYGFEHGSYTWRGYGVYSQLWGMWMLPLVWGLTWRAVAHGKRYAAAAAALALTIAFHFITGYLALLTIPVWVIVLADTGFARRVGRAALVAVGGLLVAAWVLVPLLADAKYATQSQYYQGSIFNDSYGARKVLRWLFTGGLFDDKRFPVLTILVFAGIVICGLRARRDVRARALLGAFVFSLLLFFGRATWGSLIDVLPGMGDVQIHRFVMGVHLAGILLAGVALGWLLQNAYTLAGRLAPRYSVAVAAVVPLALGVGLLTPAWKERMGYDRHGGVLIRAEQADERAVGGDIRTLTDLVKAAGDGRVYAGLRANWGKDFKVGYLPVYTWLANENVDSIGFTFRTLASLSNDVEASFDETNPAQYEMYNVRYLILPPGRSPPVPAKLVAERGEYRLFEVKTSGYFQVVDRAAPIVADRTNLNQATDQFRNSDLAAKGIYASVDFAGGGAPPPTEGGKGPAGRVLEQSEVLQDGDFTATVQANRRAVVLLKATYDPRWGVTVDGAAAHATMMAPSLVGVEVPPGRHEIHFRYEPYGWYPLLFAIGGLALLGLALVPYRADVLQFLAARGQRTTRTSPERATSSARSGEGS